jgi:hypothetical protein
LYVFISVVISAKSSINYPVEKWCNLKLYRKYGCGVEIYFITQRNTFILQEIFLVEESDVWAYVCGY